jgi:Tfp pilus assembly protein PilX
MVTAIMITMLMMGLGMATLQVVDNQARQSGAERTRESSLTLAEGALNAQANWLIGRWPNNSTVAYPSSCNQSANTTTCPEGPALVNGLPAADKAGAQLVTTVRDNKYGLEYDDARMIAENVAAYDANGDGQVWLRAQATVHGQERTIVAMAKSVPGISSSFPRYVITAGKVETTNSGRKVIIDGGQSPGIAVRCNTSPPTKDNGCTGWSNDKGQVWPAAVTTGYAQPTAMSDAELAGMKLRAQSSGTYFATCPATLPSGPLVYIENGSCSYGSNTNYNEKTSPGMLILERGTLTLGGNTNFYGIIYSANRNQLTSNMIMLGGNAQVHGAVVVDFGGGVSAGSSKQNITYDANAFNVISTNGTVVIVANSWREL